ncbi:MAG: hypothetical protein P4L74_03315 [Candidatus Doudnabacteria bacterium]|nr:hypothetical protein [Candidatus Doudnabacteria bacterium]
MINIISKSYCSRLVSGPKKVVDNLIKGLDLIGYPYVVNRRLDACRRLWIHDDAAALKKINKLPGNIKVVLGPNLFVLPRQIPPDINLSAAVYLQPSDWVRNFWKEFGFNKCPIAVWPAGIDTAEFSPVPAHKRQVILYYKQRQAGELAQVKRALSSKNIGYHVLYYGKYSEKDYKRHLASARYMVWLGRQESQGIALEEALSADVPVIVCDVKNLGHWSASQKEMAVFNQGENAYAGVTSCPYFDASCGVQIKDLDGLDQALEDMEAGWKNFQPRRYVLNNLSLEKQARDFVGIFGKYFGLSYEDGLKERLLKKGDWVNSYPLARVKFFVKDFTKGFNNFK